MICLWVITRQAPPYIYIVLVVVLDKTLLATHESIITFLISKIKKQKDKHAFVCALTSSCPNFNLVSFLSLSLSLSLVALCVFLGFPLVPVVQNTTRPWVVTTDEALIRAPSATEEGSFVRSSQLEKERKSPIFLLSISYAAIFLLLLSVSKALNCVFHCSYVLFYCYFLLFSATPFPFPPCLLVSCSCLKHPNFMISLLDSYFAFFLFICYFHFQSAEPTWIWQKP